MYTSTGIHSGSSALIVYSINKQLQRAQDLQLLHSQLIGQRAYKYVVYTPDTNNKK